MPNQPVDDYLREVIRISQEMIDLAYQGDACRQDAGCGIVFGSVRDKAYTVRRLAEQELEKHRQANDSPAETSERESSKPRAQKP